MSFFARKSDIKGIISTYKRAGYKGNLVLKIVKGGYMVNTSKLKKKKKRN